MLRSFEQLCRPVDRRRLIAADEEFASLTGHGNYAMPWHWHDCLMFILPSQGAVELKYEARREGVWLSHDRFAVIPANAAHQTKAGLGAHCHMALYATKSALSRLDSKIGSLRDFHEKSGQPMLFHRNSLIRATQTLALQCDPNAYGGARIRQDLSLALLVQCIAEVMAGPTLSSATPCEHGAALVADIKSLLARHMEDEVPLDALSARFGISRRHITRLFRQKTGVSIGEYQQHSRLKAAVALLSETDLPVGEIAYRVGFTSGAALARAMRRMNGQTPSSLRTALARSGKR